MAIDGNSELERSSPTQNAEKEIAEYLGDAELGSTRFMAFSDSADSMHYLNSAMWLREKMENGEPITESETRTYEDLYATSHLIDETIRQRTNSIPGYLRETRVAHDLSHKLRSAIEGESPAPLSSFAAESRVVGSLLTIKNTHIKKFNQE